MVQPGRSSGLDESRHLFNGMEHDMEVSGDGNSYTTQFRQYDPRLGRWKSLDPLMSSFPQISPYVGFANNPILFTDPYGLAPSNGGDGDPPKGQENEDGSFNGWQEIEGVEVSAKVPNLDQTLVDRALGQGNFASGGKFGNDYGSDDWDSFMWRTFGGNEGFKNLQRLQKKIKKATNGSSSAKVNIYNEYSYTGDGLMVHEESDGVWRQGANETILEGKAKSLKYFGYFAGGLAAAGGGVVLLQLAPAVLANPWVTSALSNLGRGARLYHSTIGMNGGYANMGLNYINQSYVTGDWGLNGKSISGLLMAGSLPYNATIGGQIMIGAADPIMSVSYNSQHGLFLNGVHNKGIGRTATESAFGVMNALYLKVPLTSSGLINFSISNGLENVGKKSME